MISENDLFKVVSKALSTELAEINMNSNSDNLPNWDSLGHIDLILEIRNHYGDDYKEDPRLSGASSVKEIFEILNSDK